MDSRPVILSIAGYDPSSGAGVTADVKTAAALGCYAVTCITALTVQSTQGVFGVDLVRAEVVRDTLFRLSADFELAAVRIGMIGSGEIARVVADFLRQNKLENVVLDPALTSSSGTQLVDKEGVEVIRNELLPLCLVVTPNFDEAMLVAGVDSGSTSAPESWETALPRVRKLAQQLHELGSKAVVITGGHLLETNDYLCSNELDQIVEYIFAGKKIETRATHGTGCGFATALACHLARGRALPSAVQEAKDYVRRAMDSAYPVGKGTGPMNHLFRLEDQENR